MSAQPIEIVDLLAGLEEHRACEHQNHEDMPAIHADGDEQFVRVNYPCGCQMPLVVVLCGRLLEVADRVRCFHCRTLSPKWDAWTPLGPANPAA